MWSCTTAALMGWAAILGLGVVEGCIGGEGAG